MFYSKFIKQINTQRIIIKKKVPFFIKMLIIILFIERSYSISKINIV